MALWMTARKESAATRYCSLPLPNARLISPRPLSSNAPNLPEVGSDSIKSNKVDISDMKIPVAIEGTEKMSSNRGTPCAGYDASENIWEYVEGARWRRVETNESREVTEEVKGISKVGFNFFGMTSVQNRNPCVLDRQAATQRYSGDSETCRRHRIRQSSAIIHPSGLVQQIPGATERPR